MEYDSSKEYSNNQIDEICFTTVFLPDVQYTLFFGFIANESIKCNIKLQSSYNCLYHQRRSLFLVPNKITSMVR